MNNKPLHIKPKGKNNDDCGCGKSQKALNPRLRPKIKKTIKKKL